MKLTVLGATGNTGLLVIQQALDAGHEVMAVMRNTSKFSLQHEKLQIKEGDIFSEEFLSGVFHGYDAVVSCLGPKTYKTSLYSDSIEIITRAMGKAGVTRLIAVTSWCTTNNSNDRGPFVLEWILKPTILKHALADMALMEAHLRDSCPDVNYTIVRPPELSNKPVTEKPIKVEVERLHVPGGPYKISRADLAREKQAHPPTDEYITNVEALIRTWKREDE